MLSFPKIAEPNIASADGCGDSYKMNITDSTITTTTDANYKHTRPRTTRMIRDWTYSWVALPEDDYNTLTAFFMQVGTFQSFTWINPADNKSYVVRLAEAMTGWQDVCPYGWQGSLKFEEV